MTLLWIARLTQIAAAVSAVLLARRRADHRPFAVFLLVVTAANLARAVLASVYPLLRPLDMPPLEGAARVAFHAEQALFTTWPAGIAAVSIALFARRRWLALLPGFAWIGLVAYLATHYPTVRGEELRRVYLVAELGALCVTAAGAVLWTWRRESPSPARVALMCVVLMEGACLLAGAWRRGFWIYWNLQQIAYVLLYLTLTAFQVITWRRSLRSSSLQ